MRLLALLPFALLLTGCQAPTIDDVQTEVFGLSCASDDRPPSPRNVAAAAPGLASLLSRRALAAARRIHASRLGLSGGLTQHTPKTRFQKSPCYA